MSVNDKQQEVEWSQDLSGAYPLAKIFQYYKKAGMECIVLLADMENLMEWLIRKASEVEECQWIAH